MIAQHAPMGRRYRVSSDSAWPLRTATGETWAERSRQREREREETR